MRTKNIVSLVLVLTSALFASCSAPSQSTPLPQAHAHNDYEHRHPLTDALDQGFCSVEADIHLVNGQLLVAHNTNALNPNRTLQSLYLEPLRKRVKQNSGHVYPNGPEFTLLIDFKTAAQPTHAALRKVLTEYADILTTFHDNIKITNAVTVILTGPYSRSLLASDSPCYAAGDGQLHDLEKNPPPNLVPWISENWKNHFKWKGTGSMPEAEKSKLRQIVVKTHQQGRQLRFWGAPDNAVFWQEMLAANVDIINTDDLKGFRKFFNDR